MKERVESEGGGEEVIGDTGKLSLFKTYTYNVNAMVIYSELYLIECVFEF